MVKDVPNNFPTNMIGLTQTSREILQDSDVPILPVVLLRIPYISTVFILVSRYPPSAWRLIQYVYDRKFSAIVRHMTLILAKMFNITQLYIGPYGGS